MRRILLVILLVGLGSMAAAPAAAQVEDYYVVNWTRFLTSEVYRIDRTGSILQTMARLNAAQIPVSLVQDEKNSGFYILGNWYGTKPFGFVEHVDAKGVHTTVHATTPWSRFPVHMLRDGDGRWLVPDNDLNMPQGIVTYDFRGTSMTTISRAVNLWAWAAAIHPDTGKILVRGQTKSSPMQFGYFLIDPNTGAWSPVATSSTLIYTALGSREPIYDASIDAFWDNPLDLTTNSGKVLRVNKLFGLSTFAYHPGLVPTSLEPGGGRFFTMPFRAVMTTAVLSTLSHFTVYDMSRAGTLAPVGTLPGAGRLWARSDMLRHQSRHLTWFMNRPPNDRTLILSFPPEANRLYVLGLSMHGATPGTPLPDGRTLPLNPDQLTELCVKGGIPGVLTGTVGYLDGNGAAAARIDVTPFAKVLKGMRIVAAAIVLDKTASSGIAIVSNATGFTVK